MKKNGLKVVIRGGGDLATAVIQKLYRCGFDVLVCELQTPRMVRRTVSVSNAIYEGVYKVEDLHATRLDIHDPLDAENTLKSIEAIWKCGQIPVVINREAEMMALIKPNVFIDATLSKRTVDYFLDKAPIVIGLGPEIEAGVNAHVVVETNRGHDLGRLIFEGFAAPNTHEPGEIAGVKSERVLRAPCDGALTALKQIGDLATAGETVAYVNDYAVITPISGMIRGMIHASVPIRKGLKIGDVDPRGIDANCHTISDKGRNIGGGVVEAIYYLL
jgi:xanthine dehydrogenase accessory factor